MVENEDAVTYLGNTNFRGKATQFGIKLKDRTKHMYVIGKSGTGKSTFLERMAIQDIQEGRGVGFLDPHGGSAEKLLEYVPEHRKKDVIYLAPFDMDYPISLNVMEDIGPDKRHLVADGLLSAFKKIWVDSFSARMEYLLRNTLLALLETPDCTLLGVNRMLADKDFRKWVVGHITDASVRSFWVDEYAKWDQRYAVEAAAAIQNKIGQFTANPIVRNMMGQPKSSFDFRDMMDNKKIFLMNLSKGRMGDENAALVGAMLITKIYLAAMSRADASPKEMEQLPMFPFYADEFQNFANDSFANILSEARKYKLALTLAHQYVEQLPETLQSAIKGNMGSMVVFRVGATDAETFEKEFAPTFLAEDFTNLGFGQMYLRIAIDGVGSKPFSAATLGPAPHVDNGFERRMSIIEQSRQLYAHPREAVEEVINAWYLKTFAPERPQRQATGSDGLPTFIGEDQDGEKKNTAPKNVFHAAEPFTPRTIQRTPGKTPVVVQIPQAVTPPPQPEVPPEPTEPKIQVSDALGSLLDKLELGDTPTTATYERIEPVIPQPQPVPKQVTATPVTQPQPIPQTSKPISYQPTSRPVQASPTQAQAPRPITPVAAPKPIQDSRPVAPQPQAYIQRPVAPLQQKPVPPTPQSRPIATTPTVPVAPKPTPIIPKAPDKAASTESRDALRSILFEAMKTAEVNTPTSSSAPESKPLAPVTESAPAIPESKPVASIPVPPAPVTETVPPPTATTEPIAPRAQSISDFRPKAIKEVPEDILRRVLE